jgi:hypothetical protein
MIPANWPYTSRPTRLRNDSTHLDQWIIYCDSSHNFCLYLIHFMLFNGGTGHWNTMESAIYTYPQIPSFAIPLFLFLVLYLTSSVISFALAIMPQLLAAESPNIFTVLGFVIYGRCITRSVHVYMVRFLASVNFWKLFVSGINHQAIAAS